MKTEVPEKITRTVGTLPAEGRLPEGEPYPFETVRPVQDGFVEHGGVRSYFAVFGNTGPTIVFAPIYPIVHMQILKGNIPYLSRHFRVVAIDACGSGRSDRTADRTLHTFDESYAQMVAVLDYLALDKLAIIGHSRSAMTAIRFASEQPDRTSHLIVIAGFMGMPLPDAAAAAEAKASGAFMRDHWTTHLDEFWTGMLPEEHSTKIYEDGVRYGLSSTGEVVEAARTSWFGTDVTGHAAKVTSPTLVIHGVADQIVGYQAGVEIHEAIPHSSMLLIDGAGHAPHGRDPAILNGVIRDFVGDPAVEQKRSRGRGRSRKALFVSSPIGLGHVQRDLAIARALRKIEPELTIDWFTVDPATRYLEQEGEHLHPAASLLASESGHFERLAGEHELQVFFAFRRMDEIMINNFMVFHDLVESEHYDVVIGDEAWDIDHYYHENPELKRQPFVFLTDFVGFLPVSDDEREAFLCADYNAETIEHVERYPYVRDEAIFVGNPDDVIDKSFGPGLPMIREWTDRNFNYSGYALPFDPAPLADTEAIRRRLGYTMDEKLVIVSVGGTGVGRHLLRKIAGSFSAMKRAIPELHMILVAGPRMSGESFPQADGLEVVPYLHNLFQHLACCDLAMVQGGLATGMELVALRRPFLSFPLKGHFEQQLHVQHRLRNYGADSALQFADITSDDIANAALAAIQRPVTYKGVETDGAELAAALIAEAIGLSRVAADVRSAEVRMPAMIA